MKNRMKLTHNIEELDEMQSYKKNWEDLLLNKITHMELHIDKFSNII